MSDHTTNVRAKGTHADFHNMDDVDLGNRLIKPKKGSPKRDTEGPKQKNAVQKFFLNLPKKFSILSKKVDAYFEKKTETEATKNIDKSIGKVFADMKSGEVSGKTLSCLSAMMKNAKKIDSDDPMGTLGKMFSDSLAKLSDKELNALACTKFGDLSDKLKSQLEHRQDRVSELVDILDTEIVPKSEGKKTTDKKSWDTGLKGQTSELQGQIDLLRDKISEARFKRMESIANGIFVIDKDGFVSGGGDNKPINPKGKVISPKDHLIDSSTALINKEINAQKPSTFGGARVVTKCIEDFPRMPITFHTPSGDKVTTRHTDTNKPTDNDVGYALSKIVEGDENASIVLSSLLNQDGWSQIFASPSGNDDRAVTLLPNSTSYESHSVAMKKGEALKLDPVQIAGAKFEVSRNDDGDFVIQLDWTAGVGSIRPEGTLERFPVSPDTPLQKDTKQNLPGSLNSIGFRLTTTVVVSGEKAKEGVLSFVDKPTIKTEYFGRVGGTL